MTFTVAPPGGFPPGDPRRALPTKDAIAALPPFAGLTIDQVRVPATVDAYREAVQALEAAKVVGFDTESKPTFSVGEVSDGPHVLQFATPTVAYIFQSHRVDALPFIVALLQSTSLVKVGFGLRSDRAFIRAKFGVEPDSVIDLNDVLRGIGYRSTTGVRAAVAILFDRRFLKSKRQTTSNWALPCLDERQLLYAANDAYAALRVHLELERSMAERPPA